MLGERVMCVCEIQTALGSAQSTASKHLKILEDAGLVVSRKERALGELFPGRWPPKPVCMRICWVICVTGLMMNLKFHSLLEKIVRIDRCEILGRN